MNVKLVNGLRISPAYVLEHNTPDDVARAMIENGHQKQAFYIFNMDEAYRRIHYFKSSMPRVKIFYAVKSNDTDMMVRLAVAFGLGFDCASPGEIYIIRQHNVNPKSIIYSMPCKTPDEMDYARETGVTHTTFDNFYELKKIKHYWPEARLLLRFRVDGKAENKFGEKFGCDFETEALGLLNKAAELELNVVGVSFQVGSNSYTPESFVQGLQQARALFDYEEKVGRRMTIVDIGGGFLSDRADRIDEVIKDDKSVNMIYLNNGKYGTMRFDENWHTFHKFQQSANNRYNKPDVDEDTILWGPTCDSLDRVIKDSDVKLPRCTAEDWLVMDNHGAYTFTYSTQFSSLETPLIRSVISKELWNYIKMSSVFELSDFVLDPDISSTLSTMPVVRPRQEYEPTDIPTLKV